MSTKKIALLGILLALNVAISTYFFPVGENLRIYFTFLINMLIANIYDYPTVFIYAIIEDLVSFFVYPTGTFFLGYTLTSVLSLTLYYIFLHKEVNLKNVILAKTSVNIFANILLNSLWSKMLFGKAYIYYLSKSVIKNILMIPIEVILFLAFYKLIKPMIDKIRA